MLFTRTTDLVQRLQAVHQELILEATITKLDRYVAFCERMLAEAGVATSPGVDFDGARGLTTMRFSYCGPEADMAEAARRLRRWD